MTRFQVDENFRDKEFAKACKREGLAEIWDFPKSLRGKEDEVVLPHFMALDKPLITNDVAIAEDHSPSIPDSNPGIIIVCYSKENPRTATMQGLRKVITNFKGGFPDWHLVRYANSILQITERDAMVWHMERGTMQMDGHLDFSDPPWPTELRSLLDRNANRNLIT